MAMLLTIRDAAEELKLGRTTVYELVASGQLESIKIGAARRIPIDAVRAYVDRLRADANGSGAESQPPAEESVADLR